ncbi:GNAT family N-acetyltransferase [Nocardia sp. NPDC057227]|uniref:GNAT family N-acetyltransferase n=1 Tax=Nocardia sp. NPDC057227 TaxID=3346056 RepID=UPI00363370DB
MEIRAVLPGDRAELLALSSRAGAGSPTESVWGHAESEAAVYLTPYFELEPESLFVAVSGGELVGYLAGCVDTAAFPSEEERMRRAIGDHRLFVKRGPLAFFARAGIDAMRPGPAAGELDDPRYPAHLHINLVPEARGTGAADALMARWFARLEQAGAPGCFLQTLVENTRAGKFFERSGFTDHGPTPLVPGLRYRGARVHQRTMVRPSR